MRDKLPATAPFKAWQSYDEQLNLLVERGLNISDRTAALQYLERIGYYRLSGYWYPLRQMDEAQSIAQHKPVRHSRFEVNSEFKQVVKLYVFDKKLRLLALDALERIEMALRVDIAYWLGKLDPIAHTKAQYLHGHFAKQKQTKGPAQGRTEHELWLEKYRALLQRARREPAIKHNCEKYGEPPIWVAIEVWDFGLMSKLYAGMRQPEQNQIAAKYGAANGNELASWLRSLNFIRNVSAHHSRLWNINVLERCAIPANQANWGLLNNQRPFLYFCLMHKMLRVICPSSGWTGRLIALFDDFPADNFNLADFGIVTKQEASRLLNV